MTTLTTEKVLDRIDEMCRVLRTNYQSYSMDYHRRAIEKNGIVDETYVSYHEEEIKKLAMGEGVDDFIYEKGKKYARIVHVSKPSNQRSAHAFVDLNTGDVFKSASWKAPAKGIRYNLLDDQSRTEMYRRADWAGGYLYQR